MQIHDIHMKKGQRNKIIMEKIFVHFYYGSSPPPPPPPLPNREKYHPFLKNIQPASRKLASSPYLPEFQIFFPAHNLGWDRHYDGPVYFQISIDSCRKFLFLDQYLHIFSQESAHSDFFCNFKGF